MFWRDLFAKSYCSDANLKHDLNREMVFFAYLVLQFKYAFYDLNFEHLFLNTLTAKGAPKSHFYDFDHIYYVLVFLFMQWRIGLRCDLDEFILI